MILTTRKRKFTDDQATLFGKTFAQTKEEEQMKQYVKGLKSQLEAIKHFQKCERCMFEFILSLERYMGRGLPWYLINSMNKEKFPECPRIEDYEIGWYGNDMTDGSKQYIKDRLVWAQKLLSEELEDREKHLEDLLEHKQW